MSLRLALASAWVPGVVKRRQLRRLLGRSALAFGAPPPQPAGRGYAALLQCFAQFTTARAETCGEQELAAVRARLRATACELASELRRTLGVRTQAEAMTAARLLYGLLGIDFEGAASGAIVIRSCSFSRAYTPRTCALVSGLDEGLLAGLTGAPQGRLEFAGRITEGCAECRATFHYENGEP